MCLHIPILYHLFSFPYSVTQNWRSVGTDFAVAGKNTEERQELLEKIPCLMYDSRVIDFYDKKHTSEEETK